MQNIPMDLLRTFVKTIESGSLTRTAGLIGRTQSAVSLQIRRLEDIVGTQLFQRDAHKLNLTADGQAFSLYARRILALNDEALASIQKPTVAGRVRLGAPHEYTASLLPEFLGKFAQSHPNVMLEVTSDLSRNLLRRQQDGEFDLVIALHDDRSNDDGRKIFTEPLTWVGSNDHARHQQSPIPLVLAPPPCMYRQRVLQALNQRKIPNQVAYLSSSYNGISAAVKAGIGITAMAGSTIPPESRILNESDDLPSLGQLELRLHRANDVAFEALQRLEDYIEGSFSSAAPRRTNATGS